MNTPSVGSSVKVNPAAGVGSGTDTIWLASEMLNCVNSAWNALLKWAECVPPPGRGALLSTKRPEAPYRLGMRKASFSCARAGADAAKTMTAATIATRFFMNHLLERSAA